MTDYVLCVDPGKATGVALVKLTKNKPLELVEFSEVVGDAKGMYNMLSEYARFGDLKGGLQIVCEDWHARKLKFVPDPRHACEPAGMVKMFGHWVGVPVIMQLPQFRLRGVPDTRKELEPLGYWIHGEKGYKASAANPEGLQGHARQALRHGLAWALHTRKHRPTIDHLRSLV